MSKRKLEPKLNPPEIHVQSIAPHRHIQECEDHESCRQLLSTLGEYVDGTLSPELCTELERHMQDCQRCRIVVDTMKKTVELYQETGEETQLPDDVRARLYLRLNLEDYLNPDSTSPDRPRRDG